MGCGAVTIGAGLYGSTVFGSTGTLTEDLTPPDEPSDLPWDPDAPTPTDPPENTPTVPEAIFEVIERSGTHVAWIDRRVNGSWRRDTGRGCASVTVQRTDPILSTIVPPRMLRVRYRGKVVQDALIQPLQESSVAQQEEAGQTLEIVAPGHGAILEEGAVGPWSSTSRPASDSQRFSPAHPNYTMTPGWGHALELARQDQATTFWTGLPAKWPAPTAYYIAGGSDTHADAEPGHLHARRKYTTETRTYAVCWSADNFSEMFVDGVRQGETRDFQGFQRVDVRLTAGEHTFYCHWENEQRESGNPTFFLFSLHPIDSAGRLGDAVLVSDSSWWILDRPVNPPGWKVHQIIDYLLDKWHGRGGRSILRSWTTLTDTNGESSTTVPDLSIPGSSQIGGGLDQLAETYVDWNMRPGIPFTLDVWNKGGRSVVRDVQLASGYNDPNSPVLTLDHTTDPPYATSIFGHWGDGWLRRSKSVPGYYIERTLEIPNVLTRDEAIDTLDKLLDAWGRERIEYRLTIRPRNDAQRPHISYHVADLIEVEGPDGELDQVQVQAIEGKVNDGDVTFDIEAGDLRLLMEERIFTTMRRMIAGAFGGRTAQPTTMKVERPSQLVASEIRPLRFHRPATVVETESDPDTPEESGRIRNWVATVNPTQGFDVDVDLYVNGAPSGVTVTVPAGQVAGRRACNLDVQQDADLISAHCVDTGFALVAKAIFE